MSQIKSGDAEIVYEVFGSGAPVVLLHPFPVHRAFWKPAAQDLFARYQAILPDLRGHGDSGLGDGPATMEKHALDLARILNEEKVDRAIFVGVSIGGYVLFEFWRRFRGRVVALGLCNTKAAADGPEARANRMKSAASVLERGTEPFFEGLVPMVMGKTTVGTRPDLVDGALTMMRKMSPEDVAGVQRGMAERPDSIETLKTIDVPTLVVTGDEDTATGVQEAEIMRQHIRGAEMKVISRAGHYSPWEQAEEVGKLIRQFADRVSGN
ncbi:MAG TPA: alpha/beta fold hydrolase [Terriglobales bacterium]